MTGIQRISHEQDEEVLRMARGARLGQASNEEYRQAVRQAESALEPR